MPTISQLRITPGTGHITSADENVAMNRTTSGSSTVSDTTSASSSRTATTGPTSPTGPTPPVPPVRLAAVGLTGPAEAMGESSGNVDTIADDSANPASIPLEDYVLLQTIPVNLNRVYVEIQNQSGDTVQVVRDDGTGGNATTILLASGGSAATQGGGWSSSTFVGRLRIYGMSGDQVAAYEE